MFYFSIIFFRLTKRVPETSIFGFESWGFVLEKTLYKNDCLLEQTVFESRACLFKSELGCVLEQTHFETCAVF